MPRLRLTPEHGRACAVEMHCNISEKPLYTEICRKNAAPQNRGPHFARACAVEMHVNISQEPLYTDIYRKNAAAQLEHPDQAPAFTPNYRKNSSVWTHCLGEKRKGDVLGYCSVSVLTNGGSQKEAVRSRKAPLLPRTLVTVPFRRSWKTRHWNASLVFERVSILSVLYDLYACTSQLAFSSFPWLTNFKTQGARRTKPKS